MPDLLTGKYIQYLLVFMSLVNIDKYLFRLYTNAKTFFLFNF